MKISAKAEYACLAVLALTNALYVAACCASWLINVDDPLSRTLVCAMMALFFTQLDFLAFGVAWAVLAKKVRSASGIATAIGLAGFIAMALNGILREDFLGYFSPLSYFSPSAAFETASFETRFAATGLISFVAFMGVAYARYVRSDVHAL